MAEKKTGMTFDVIMRNLKSRKFAPVYFLMGEEAYFIDKISDYIADNVLPVEERDFNQSIVYGTDYTMVQVVDMARRYPMMSEYQVVIIKEAQNLRDFSALEKYAATQVMPTTILVICYKNGSLDRKRKGVASLLSKIEAAGGIVFESKKKSERELPGFIENYLKAQGVAIDNKSSQMIADHIGSDLNRLVSELEKTMLSLPDSDRRITPDIVEREIGVSKEFNAYELQNAIIRKDVFKANQIIKYFDSTNKGESLYSFIPKVFRYFQNLMTAYNAPDKSPAGLVNILELRGTWAADEYILGLRNYSGKKILQIISKIREIEAKSKGLDNPNTKEYDLFRELIFFILH